MTGITEITDIKNRFKMFMDGVRTVMLIDRDNNNTNKGSKRWIKKIITTNETEWIDAVSYLLTIQEFRDDDSVRLYSSVNTRKIDSAIKTFQHKQLDLQPDMVTRFYTHINDSFFSCLMAPENKLSKYFLMDIDTRIPIEADRFISEHLIQVVMTYPTKNGWHYIVEPFNTEWAMKQKDFTLLKDGLLLLNYLD